MKIHSCIALALTATLLGGCATYKKKFQDKTVANIGLFADSTIALLSNMDMTISREDTLLVRRFISGTSPEELLVMKLNKQLKTDLSNMVRYSIEIVNIAESDGSETNRVQLYADFLVKFRDGLVESENIDFKVFDDTIEEVQQQTEFLEALRKAQPLLNAGVTDACLEVEDLIEAVTVLSRQIDDHIDEEYSDIIRYRAKLEREKFDILTAFENIYDAYRKEEPNLEALRASGVIWTPEIIPEGRPSRADLKAIGEHLHSRMQALHMVQEEMKPNWEDYMSTHKELDKITDDTIASAQRARIMMLTWVRAHQKMSSGTTDPAKWFDIGEVTKSLVKSAPGAIL